MKDNDFKIQLFNDILKNILKYYNNPIINENTEYITIKCPSCLKETAFIYKNNPVFIKCNRLNECFYEKNNFDIFIKKYKKENNLIEDNDEDIILNYLKSRKVEKIINNKQISIKKEINKNIFIYDFNEYIIKHYYMSDKIKYIKQKGKQKFIHLINSQNDKALYITEGIYDLFTLSIMKKNVACSLGSLSISFLNNIKNLLSEKIYDKLILCYDNDNAGECYTKKTIDFFKNVQYEYINWKEINIVINKNNNIKDINDLFCKYSEKDIKKINLFISSENILEKHVIGDFYNFSANESYDLYKKTPSVWFKNYDITIYNGLNIIGARTSHFKTSFMLNLFNDVDNALQFSDSEKIINKIILKPVFITLEEDIGNIIKKLTYINFKQNNKKNYISTYNKFLSKKNPIISLNYNEWNKILDLINKLIKLEYNLFFIDYLQLIKNLNIETRYQAIAEITNDFNRLGNIHGIYFLISSQLTEKNFNDNLPTLNMLRESSNIANDAKNIYLLEYLINENIVLICNPKNRYDKKTVFEECKNDIKKTIKKNKHYIIDKFKIINYIDPFKNK